MNKLTSKIIIALTVVPFLFGSRLLMAQQAITIKVSQPVAPIQPTMWGVFFEDINMGADGGIYAELVKNRSFEFFRPMMGWSVMGKPATEGDFQVLNREKANTANPRFLRVTLHNNAKGSLGLSNEGFRGMGIKLGLEYNFSMMYRNQGGAKKLHLDLVNSKGDVIASGSTDLTANGEGWSKATAAFKSSATEQKARFHLWFEGDGVLDLDMVSLFPEDTWKKRPGGMRADMIQKLADLKPGFVRFPGGCIVEGFDLSQRYQWKNTIGPVEDRQLIINRWNFEFATTRPAPDYFQTFGLGFFEYFQLAEDIGAEPLPIINAGMACQFNSAELVPLDALDPYVQDALDLIEFANGNPESKWGKVRAGMGHPEPFHLKFLGVGNENWGPQYLERLRIFTKAIKAKYPEIKLVNSSGTDPNGDRFNYLNTELRNMKADIIDEHYYRRPEWFLQNATRYDSYDRNSSKIFAGEYAAQSDKTVSVNNKNNWQTALSEAAFMTGLERNAAVVHMASYAPLFAHADGWQWTPDLIWVDNLRSYGTPDYYVQQLFSTNKGTDVLPITMNNAVVAGQDSLYATACLDKRTNELIIKLVNASAQEKAKPITLEGIRKTGGKGTLTVLQNKSLEAMNSFEQPDNIAPVSGPISITGNRFATRLPAYSFSVYRIAL